MNGQETIRAARKAGYKPGSIFFEVDLGRGLMGDPETFLRTKKHATVEMEIAEAWREEDFRFVHDCTVHLHAPAMCDDLIDLSERLAAAGARMVVLCTLGEIDPMLIFKDGAWNAY
jgi:hypothetical protein